jgi:hypothetical protein
MQREDIAPINLETQAFIATLQLGLAGMRFFVARWQQPLSPSSILHGRCGYLA